MVAISQDGSLLDYMSKTIQIRKVPNSLHRKLKARAAAAGMSLSNYFLAEIRDIADKPSLEEFRDRLRRREPVTAEINSAALIREARGD
jgi:plasmid stability protein